MKTLLLKLAGPLQSWGTSSHFETRQTDFYPSKSAIIGMIAASMGYQRNDDEKIRQLNDLDFAVRIDQQGNLLRDYHTAKKYKDNGQIERTYVTNRYYLEDAVFVCAIGHENPNWIDEIAEALQSPYYQTYMGRRSLPVQADFFLGTTSENVIEALQRTPRQSNSNSSYDDQRDRGLFVYADAHLLPEQPKNMSKDVVFSFSQKERKFGYRAVAKTRIEVETRVGDTDHDAFGAIGG